MSRPLLQVEDLVKHFPVTEGVFSRVCAHVKAVDGVSFEIGRGETLGLVGESGCGKTTVGRSVLRLIEPSSGRIRFDGRDLMALSPSELREARRDLQIVFQDPFSSLNPRMTIREIVGEALEVHGVARGAEAERRVVELLERVGIPGGWIHRYPHEFSGGQRQRIGVARAIALDPKLVVCDEAVSALDVSVQAQVINLLIQLRREMNLSYLFIAHDLSVVKHISHRVAVMYLGEIVETAPSARLFEAAAHPYTRALLSAIPVPNPRRRVQRILLPGDVPTPLAPPPGCRFHTRCPAVQERCRSEVPPEVELEPGHQVRCVHAEGLAGDADADRRIAERIERAVAVNRARATAPAAPAQAPAGVPAPAQHQRIETRPRWRPRLSLAAASTAAAVGLLGAPFWAIAWAGLAGVLLPPLRPERRRRLLLLGGVGLALAIAGGVGFEALVRRAELRAQERALRAEIERYAEVTGAYPADLAALGWRLPPIFGVGRAVDPWGRPWRYAPPAEGGAAFTLASDRAPEPVPPAP